MELKIRKAKVEDAPLIANIHITSWKETYQGLLNQTYLDDLHLNFKKRMELWQKLILNEEIIFVAETDQYGVIGFFHAGKNRDQRLEGFGEIYAIYLFKKFHQKGIGYKLLKKSFEELRKLQFHQFYLWVLKGNPTIHFYEKVGGKKLDFTLEDKICDQTIVELCYIFNEKHFSH